MLRVVDLELWSRPYQHELSQDGKELAAACRGDTNLATDVVLGLNFVPGPLDVQELAADFGSGEATLSLFEDFCRGRALPADPQNARSAAEFRASRLGQPLAWLHFPSDATGREMAARLYKWANIAGLCIKCGQGEKTLSEAEVFQFWPD